MSLNEVSSLAGADHTSDEKGTMADDVFSCKVWFIKRLQDI
ncbi:hypothetical protein BCU00_001705 [Vibrio breoganii]